MPYRVMQFFKSLVDLMHSSLLDDYIHNIELYQIHRVCMLNQRRYIDEIVYGMFLYKAFIVLDLKTEFETMY